MPNRYIRASAIESESINALNWRAEVFYRRLLNRADDFGRYTASPQLLRASLFPLQLDRITDADIVDLLTECESVGLIFRYDASGKPLLVINKWEQGRAKASEYAPPPKDICERMFTYVYTSKGMHPTPTPTPTPTQIPIPTLGSSGLPAAPSPEPTAKKRAKAKDVPDDVWIESLKANPAYAGIDVAQEFGKARAWCDVNKKTLSRRRFINWLNRAESPMKGDANHKPSPDYAKIHKYTY